MSQYEVPPAGEIEVEVVAVAVSNAPPSFGADGDVPF
jgi:hypothetical protein